MARNLLSLQPDDKIHDWINTEVVEVYLDILVNIVMPSERVQILQYNRMVYVRVRHVLRKRESHVTMQLLWYVTPNKKTIENK